MLYDVCTLLYVSAVEIRIRLFIRHMIKPMIRGSGSHSLWYIIKQLRHQKRNINFITCFDFFAISRTMFDRLNNIDNVQNEKLLPQNEIYVQGKLIQHDNWHTQATTPSFFRRYKSIPILKQFVSYIPFGLVAFHPFLLAIDSVNEYYSNGH